MNLYDISLHDAYIVGLEVKTLRDHFECIILSVESEEFKKEFGKENIKIIFEDCYKANFALQMWISGKDTIKDYRYNSNSEWIRNVELLHDNGTIPSNIRFNHFSFELNTSGGTIDILARDIRIEFGC